MDNHKKMVNGIINASAEKRFKNFISTVADNEEVWMLDGGEGYCTYDDDGNINIIVYPTREFAEIFSEGAKPVMMEVHEFCEKCKEFFDSEKIGFVVFPNKINGVKISAYDLYYALGEELEKVEYFWENQ